MSENPTCPWCGSEMRLVIDDASMSSFNEMRIGALYHYNCPKCLARSPVGHSQPAALAAARQPAPEPAEGRVETGCVKFDDDWRGLFIRGDDCLGFLAALRAMSFPEDRMGALTAAPVRHLMELLDAANEHNKDVPVRRISTAAPEPRDHGTFPEGAPGWSPHENQRMHPDLIVGPDGMPVLRVCWPDGVTLEQVIERRDFVLARVNATPRVVIDEPTTDDILRALADVPEDFTMPSGLGGSATHDECWGFAAGLAYARHAARVEP